MDPLFHFLRYGAVEGRKPHPLFDPTYYLEKYPDVARSGYNPLLHFMRFGGFEGRQPHPDFDAKYYRAKHQDATSKGMNPLVHFLRFGASEGRLPHPDFNREFYLAAHPDVAAAKMDPVVHFARHGAAEGRFVRPGLSPNPPPDCFLPVRGQVDAAGPDRAIDVVVPAYKGVDETKACIESVLSSKCLARFRLVVINDNSPELELASYLRRLALDRKITLIDKSENRGFVESVNAGIEAGDHDVVLLNSDTLVFDGWLDRLAACAYSDQRTGTVTPFSNNATICSYPVFCSDNRLPAGLDPAPLDAAFAAVNRGRSVDIPTAVGFCMYIRRECLRETGPFDAEAFGLGYGEENDFCMRATSKGWAHKLACDVFVHHTGGVSFGNASARRQTAMQVLTQKYPGYLRLVDKHVKTNPANGYRIAVTAYRLQHSGKRVFLSIVHPLGGGLAQHSRALMASTTEEVIWLELRPMDAGRVILECDRAGYQFSLALEPHLEYEQLATVVRACGVERIHIHHLMGHGEGVARLIRDLQVPFDFTIHDYYTICPQVTLSDEHGRYCDEPDESGCRRCMALRPPTGNVVDITSWRAKYAWVLGDADRVIAPTADAGVRIRKYYPQAPLIMAEHENAPFCTVPTARLVLDGEPLRVAVLGAMAIHKGLELLRDCSAHAENSGMPVQFVLVGSIEAGLARDRIAFTATGPYEAADLPSLLQEVAPHLVWFPACWPETFSYTLSTCLELGLPLAAHRMGAFSERLGGRPWTWTVPPNWSAVEWAELFCQVRRDNFMAGVKPTLPPVVPRALPDFYPDRYLKTSETAKRPPATSGRNGAPIFVAATVASHASGQIQACGYVRIIQPLTHPALAGTIRLELMNPSSLVTAEADVVLIQRDAVRDLEVAERIVQACQRRGARLIYEIDDDLFEIPPEHPEYVKYLQVSRAMNCIAAAADTIITSTEALREKMLGLNPNTLILPNYLDDRLWHSGPDEMQFDAGAVRILYMGTVSHRDDLEFLGRAFEKVNPTLRRKLRIDVVGVTGEAESNDWFQPIRVPSFTAASYPRFVEWIQSRNIWHWGVAPLLDTPFNRCKSCLKFLEYAALRLPSICSDVQPYHETVRHEETGLLLTNDPEEWAYALETAARDVQLWSRLRKESGSVFCENTIAARAQTMRSQWFALAKGRATSATAREGT
jgi:GT2 family glycosyltransferase/glycosyltransferase involved in cell wall biosynthesis